MPKLLHRVLTTLCVGLLATTPAFAKGKKTAPKPAPPETEQVKKEPAPPVQQGEQSPAPSEASAPSGGGGW